VVVVEAVVERDALLTFKVLVVWIVERVVLLKLDLFASVVLAVVVPAVTVVEVVVDVVDVVNVDDVVRVVVVVTVVVVVVVPIQ
jgi:hypothetical protein